MTGEHQDDFDFRADLSRRALLAGTAAGLAGLTVGSADPAYGGFTTMTATQAEKLADHFGVVIHLNFQNDIYGHEHAVVAKMKEIGARHARSRLTVGLDGVRRGFVALADAGCTINGTCQVFGLRHQPSARELMREVREFYDGDRGGVFSSFEGVNEPNNNGVPWVRETRGRTKALWEAAKAHAATDSIPIIGPSLADTWTLKRDYRELGDLRRFTDWGSIHMYPRGTRPSVLINEHVRWARQSYGHQPFVCTEGGYNNLLRRTRLQPVPEAVAGIYGPRHLLEHFIRGNRFFRYELLDDVDPDRNDWEAHFGLIAVKSKHPEDWRDKPAFTSMKRFMNVIGDRGPAFLPGQLALSLSGGGADFRRVLVQKRDGTFLLIVWRDISVYDATRQRRLRVNADRITLQLATPAQVRVFAPSRQAGATATPGVVDSCRFSLGGDVKVLEITP
jgi:hypothetical protein